MSEYLLEGLYEKPAESSGGFITLSFSYNGETLKPTAQHTWRRICDKPFPSIAHAETWLAKHGEKIIREKVSAIRLLHVVSYRALQVLPLWTETDAKGAAQRAGVSDAKKIPGVLEGDEWKHTAEDDE